MSVLTQPGHIELTAIAPRNSAARIPVTAFNAEPGRLVPLSMSVGGAALQPNALTSLDELLAAADRAMYEQKPAAAAHPERAGERRFRSAARIAASD